MLSFATGSAKTLRNARSPGFPARHDPEWWDEPTDPQFPVKRPGAFGPDGGNRQYGQGASPLNPILPKSWISSAGSHQIPLLVKSNSMATTVMRTHVGGERAASVSQAQINAMAQIPQNATKRQFDLIDPIRSKVSWHRIPVSNVPRPLRTCLKFQSCDGATC